MDGEKAQIRIALPKGRLLDGTAALLQKAGWGLGGYHERARFYRLESRRFPHLLAKLFHEKDIPIQVAIGNYDLGICGLDWVEELLTKYPSSALIKVMNLEYGEGILYMAANRSRATSIMEEIQSKWDNIRIVTEYPNLAESFAIHLRLRRFSIFPVWGAAEAYPPEAADLALIPAGTGAELNYGLVPVSNILNFSAFLVANKGSWETKDMNNILASLKDSLSAIKKQPFSADMKMEPETASPPLSKGVDTDLVRLALPDGHQQLPVAELLKKAGIWVDDYPSGTGNRRPTTTLANVVIKVIRPQDMPLQVANGNFDLAITGDDWLREHLYQFPSSPVTELLNLKLKRVKIVAVVSEDLPVENVNHLRRLHGERKAPIRVASEYVNIADKYARDNHLGMYKVVPTWGASEAFLPEDADLLIENTETGKTLAMHSLKIIDTLFESAACLIGNTRNPSSVGKADRMRSIVEALQAAVKDT